MSYAIDDAAGLSRSAQVVLLHAAIPINVSLFQTLPGPVQEFVAERLVEMVKDGGPVLPLDQSLCDLNPAPARVANPLKWRNTLPVRGSLKVSIPLLEQALVKMAHPTWSRRPSAEIVSVVAMLRAYTGSKTLAEYVGDKGMDGLTNIIKDLFPLSVV